MLKKAKFVKTWPGIYIKKVSPAKLKVEKAKNSSEMEFRE